MKKIITTIALAGTAVSANAFVEDLSLSGSFDYESQYIFRGLDTAGHSFQPSVEAGYPVLGGDFYTGIWASQDVSNNSSFNEIDFYTGFAYPLDDMFTLDTGFTYYMYPDNGAGVNVDRSREIYIGVSADVILSPAVYFYYDFDFEATVLEGSIGHSLDLGDLAGLPSSLDLGAYLGWADADDTGAGQAGPAGSNGWTYYGVSADIVTGLSDNASTSFGVRYAGNNDDAGLENAFWFGASVSFAK